MRRSDPHDEDAVTARDFFCVAKVSAFYNRKNGHTVLTSEGCSRIIDAATMRGVAGDPTADMAAGVGGAYMAQLWGGADDTSVRAGTLLPA